MGSFAPAKIPAGKAGIFTGAPAGIRTPAKKSRRRRLASRLIRSAQKMLRILVSGVRISSQRQKAIAPKRGRLLSGAPAGIRTPDTLLKRQVLCRLSYWGGLITLTDGNGANESRSDVRGRGGRTRTCEWRSQSPMCYHFTTPLRRRPAHGFAFAQARKLVAFTGSSFSAETSSGPAGKNRRDWDMSQSRRLWGG